MSKNLAQFGAALKARRKAMELTMDEATTLSGVARSTIQRIEAGDQAVSLATLIQYGDAIQIGGRLVDALVDAASDGRAKFSIEVARAKLGLLESARRRK